MKITNKTQANTLFDSKITLNKDSILSKYDTSSIGVVTGLLYPKIVTAIGKQHVLCAKHYPLKAGDNIKFTSTSGQEVTVTVRSSVSSLDDMEVYLVDKEFSTVGVSIAQTAKFDTSIWNSFLSFIGLYRSPCFSVGVDLYSKSVIVAGNAISSITTSPNGQLAGLKQGTVIVEDGDSGAPDFIVSEGKLLLVGGHYSVTPRVYYTSIAHKFISSLNFF